MNENINKWDYIKLKYLYIATENTSRGIKKLQHLWKYMQTIDLIGIMMLHYSVTNDNDLIDVSPKLE